MNKYAYWYSSTTHSFQDMVFESGSILFHGRAIDERGTHAITADNQYINARYSIEYDVNLMTLKLNGVVVSADQGIELFKPLVGASSHIVLESTTLGFAELFCTIKALIALGVINFEIIYLEPIEYSTKPSDSETYSLTDSSYGYKAIPGSIVDLSSDDVEAGVFFLGFEQERLDSALEDYPMIQNKEIKLVFGVPAFKPGWEMKAVVPHLKALSDNSNFNIAYCAANEPSSAYDCLEETRKALEPGSKMFVGPIGTKPCGIATALFASINPLQVGLLYDHPNKTDGRTKGVKRCYKYSISILER